MAADKLPVVAVLPGLQPLYASRIDIAAPLEVGDGPHGKRRVINILGGAFSGARLAGRQSDGDTADACARAFDRKGHLAVKGG